ncbi:MAG: deoxyribodipyrimidine photo-lyase [Chloroflexi bacterium]|nr:deoxyribodipyrimidine photo-lyase [Chloroflexota bacterium]
MRGATERVEGCWCRRLVAMRTIVWFRGKDLRVRDHEPLVRAAASGEVIPLLILEESYFGASDKKTTLGGQVSKSNRPPHRLQFFLDAVASLTSDLEALGSALVTVRGRATDVVPRLTGEWNADAVFAQAAVEPGSRRRDHSVATALGEKFRLFGGETVHPPGSLRTQAGRPYGVFSPFAKSWRREVSEAPAVGTPARLTRVPDHILDYRDPLPDLRDLGIERNPALLKAGSAPAEARLKRFLTDAGSTYKSDRDRMGIEGTSRLSVDLKFGTIAPRRVWLEARDAIGETQGGNSFESELIWREFSYSTLWDVPSIVTTPFQPDFAGFPWRDDEIGWRAWVDGLTGYPVVDASARQLRAEGFVHNRARMVSASFLTKDLMIDFRRGERHYLHYLTDGDLAQNTAGWQWTTGCGCDPQPYFRIFNPVSQGERFDPDGAYVRKWVPELRDMPSEYIHHPWDAPEALLRTARVRLGDTYPRPIVDHSVARDRFLDTASRHLKRPPGSQTAPVRLPID